MTDDDEWAQKLDDEQEAADAARLAEAKREAAREGKEPFDLDKFDELEHPPHYGTREERIADYERQYYTSEVVRYWGIRTMKDFAALLMRLDVDKDG